MTPETRKLLLTLIDEYENSLTRAQGEKDLQKSIEERAVCECGLTGKAFKTVATAFWRDQVNASVETLEEQLEAFELVRGDLGNLGDSDDARPV